ncbi:DUF4334 domain-containing protein [Streptosporangium fragile]|uniref:DUF4334 domain-containing protein n=1 Tax=Streptosporangium fragile TaxID=46186 RepID=UPI0031E7B601
MSVDQFGRVVPEELRTRPDGAAALRYFDSLGTVTIEEMLGLWRGSGLNTGHPMDGLLETFGWYGKRFDSPEEVHPLVFPTGKGRLFCINPSFLPVGVLLRHPGLARLPVAPRLFGVARPLIATTRPQARLRMTQHRGVVTATMCYDRLPAHDAFRRIDENTVMGAMDIRGLRQPLMFLLRRERIQR